MALPVSTGSFGDIRSITPTDSLRAGKQCDQCYCKNSFVYDIVVKNSKVEVHCFCAVKVCSTP